MDWQNKLPAGAKYPQHTLRTLSGEALTLGAPRGDADWQLVVIYRGRHCPLCTRYLNELEGFLPRLHALGIDVVAASGDSQSQLEEHMSRLQVSFPLAYGLSVAQMRELGVYISIPRSEQETDHEFAEPGLFVVNEHGTVQVVDISNNPFVRPQLEALVSGLEWIRNPDNHYPIRGTFEGN
ncbi:redoxin family protein [Shewanella corallii]|uniref:Redoxin family protein n=2 Tax=Shewanella TaxID=22 RepID=A0ABT0N495_9GAMM|nr:MULTISPECIES: redoxin domain-containing protein [Shewanella]MCL1036386.1 redoxin family protein [Shewanella submarina]MCL2912995.1 redoxin family protein [Shewanella corallii]